MQGNTSHVAAHLQHQQGAFLADDSVVVLALQVLHAGWAAARVGAGAGGHQLQRAAAQLWEQRGGLRQAVGATRGVSGAGCCMSPQHTFKDSQHMRQMHRTQHLRDAAMSLQGSSHTNKAAISMSDVR